MRVALASKRDMARKNLQVMVKINRVSVRFPRTPVSRLTKSYTDPISVDTRSTFVSSIFMCISSFLPDSDRTATLDQAQQAGAGTEQPGGRRQRHRS